MYRTLLFDMDGVLLDTERMSYHILADYLAGLDYCLTKERYAGICGMPPAEFEKLPGAALPMTRQELWIPWEAALLKRIREDRIPTKPGFAELMDFLREYPGKKAIVTSNGGPVLEGYAARFGFRQVFDRIIDVGMTPHRKPAPDPYLLACRELGVEPGDCLAVEDSQWGVLSARGAGIPAIHMRGFFEITKELEADCLAAVTSLAQVIPFAIKTEGEFQYAL